MNMKVSLAAGVSALALVVASAAVAQDSGRQGGKPPEASQAGPSSGSRASETGKAGSGKADSSKSDSGKGPGQRSEGARDESRGAGKASTSAQPERRSDDQGKGQSRAKAGSAGKTAEEGANQSSRQGKERQVQDRQSGKSGTADRSEQRQEKSRQAAPASKEPQRNSGKAAAGEERERSGASSPSKQSGTTQPSGKQPDTRQSTAPSKDGKAAAQSDRDRGADRQGETTKTGSRSDDRRDNARAERLSDQQRTVVRERILQQRPARANVNVNINVSVGTRLPRNVRTVVLPLAIVQEVPAWRGYHYVVVRDEILIVQPSTYQVVDVIETRGGSGIQHATLELSREQRRIVYETVHERYRPVDLRIRLGLGAQIPRTVEVQVFPADLVRRIPELERYRCVVAEDQVVIVEPGSREVVLVIDRS